MAEQEASPMGVEEVWSLVSHRRWWILGTLFVCWAIAWTLSWKLPARYRSETLILVEHQKVPEEYVVSNVTTDMQERLRTMTQQILSRTRLQRIISDFGLYSKAQSRLAPDQVVELMRKDIEIELVQTPGQRDLNAFRVYYSAPNPELAQKVASQLTSLFIQENLLAQQEQSERTTEFLSSEVEQARQSLALQETKVREFKSRYLGQLPSQMQGNVEILTGLQSRYEALTGALNRSQQQKLYLESLLNQYRSLGVIPGSGPAAPRPVDEELIRLRRELADARSRYTEQHPDVQRLKDQIADAEKRRQQMAAGNKNEDDTRTSSTSDLQAVSPILQLESQLKANAQEVKDTQQQLSAVEQQIKEYQARLNLSPVREQQLGDLTRDYEQSKANYDSLLKKQMQSQLATNLERRQEGQQFRVLDPPSLPNKPVWPDRIKFSLGGLGGGLALGLILAFLLEKSADLVRTEKQLNDLLSSKLPAGLEIMSPRALMVGIPHIAEPGETRRRAWRIAFEWVAAAIILATIAAGNAISFYRG